MSWYQGSKNIPGAAALLSESMQPNFAGSLTELMQFVFSISGYAYFIVDARRRAIVGAGDGVEKVLGIEDGESVIGKKCDEVMRHKSSSCAALSLQGECPLTRALEEGNPFKTRHVHLTSETKPVCHEIIAYPLAGWDGSIKEVIFLIREVKGSEEFQKRTEQMEGLGSSKIVAELAHQLKNSLAVIRGTAELCLSRHHLPASLHELVNEIRNIALQSADFLRKALNFSRPAEMKLAPHHLNVLIEETLHLFGSRLSKVEVNRIFADNLPQLTCDENHLVQGFVNIIGNSLEAMGEAGEITIETAFEEEVGQLIATFKDAGPGFPAGSIDKVTEPFFTTKEEGTGLGLSLCRRIINGHEGDLSVSNNPDRGACVTIRLPAAAVKKGKYL